MHLRRPDGRLAIKAYLPEHSEVTQGLISRYFVMKATLYEALGIPPAASDEEVRTALRQLIRKYYAKTRDGQGNVEEALRFINHASRILTDREQRQRYDQELAVSAEGNTELRLAHFVSDVAAELPQDASSGPGDD